jgi:hypothetical protein
MIRPALIPALLLLAFGSSGRPGPAQEQAPPPHERRWRAYEVVPLGEPPRKFSPRAFDRIRSGMTLGELVAVLGPGRIPGGPYFSGCGIILWTCEDGRELSVWPVTHGRDEVIRVDGGSGGVGRMWMIPAVRTAAPADKAPWGQPAEGIRVRLLSRETKYKVGEPLVLALEIQNVSKAEVSLKEPHLMPVISYPDNHPYGKHSYTWVITCEIPGGNPCICWDARQELQRVPSRLRLKPGETYRVAVEGVSLRKEFDPERSGKRGEPQRDMVHFVGADEPGVYLLKATFARRDMGLKQKAGGEEGTWSAERLETPEIRVEMVK